MSGRTALGVLLVLAVGAQLVPVDRSNPPVTAVVPMTADAEPILRRACWDCHTRETVWPWYAHVAPVSWLVAHDVHEAREHLDLTAWDQYPADKQRKLLDELIEEVHEGEMPLWYYVLVHPDAALSNDDLDLLDAWVGSLLDSE